MSETKHENTHEKKDEPAVEKRWHVMAFSTSTKLKDSLTSNNIVSACTWMQHALLPTNYYLCSLIPATASLGMLAKGHVGVVCRVLSSWLFHFTISQVAVCFAEIAVSGFASSEFDLSALKPREEVTVDIVSTFAEVRSHSQVIRLFLPDCWPSTSLGTPSQCDL